MLFGYATSSLLNAVLWISFAAIDDATAAFYHVSTDQVNWLAIVFQVCSISRAKKVCHE